MAKQFRGHILLGAPLSVQSPRGVELRHTVVGKLHVHSSLLVVEGPDEDVARLDVPVNNVEGVQVADTISNLQENRQIRLEYQISFSQVIVTASNWHLTSYGALPLV